MSEQDKLFDRQVRVIGKEAMAKLAQQKILLLGLSGLGVEIAKNLILMGIPSITLYDDKNVSWMDLSSQFFFSEKDVGKNRVTASIEKLRVLNNYCIVNQYSGKIDEEFIKTFSIVVVTDESIPSLVELNELCRRNKVKFIAGEDRGVFGSVFVDFGENFLVIDENGEQPSEGIINNIIIDENGIGIVDTKDEDNVQPHNLSDTDKVILRGVKGMTEINNKPLSIKVLTPHTFSIGDVSKFGKYEGGGHFYQKKQPITLHFKSLAENLKNPEIKIYYNFATMDRLPQMHVAFLALHEFIQTHKRLPESYDEEDAKEMEKIGKKLDETYKTGIGDSNILKILSYTARGRLNPMATLLGGIIAQEVQKGSTGKFTPIHQYFYFECMDCLPDPLPKKEDVQPIDNRYDGQIAIFGRDIQRKIGNSKYFIVGAGALGCEFLKNFAMMGVGCGVKGHVYVTDMDSIEVSNLSRQFLFRREHVGQMKSQVATKAAKEMNPHLNITTFTDRVGKETEEIFNDSFWESLDGVTNALDNVEARKYVDSKCVYYKKPLLESGTLGTKGNVQVIIPYKTLSYSSTTDPDQNEFPMCTVHYYPNVIQHTIIWAKSIFNTFFTSSIQAANAFIRDPKAFLEEKKDDMHELITVSEVLISRHPKNYEDCISIARKTFEEQMVYQIMNVLHSHPPDEVTSTGAKFWSGNKRCPTLYKFDENDQSHIDYIKACANLYAEVYGIPINQNIDIISICKKTELPKFVPTPLAEDKEKKEENEKMDEKEIEKKRKLHEEKLQRLVTELEKYAAENEMKLLKEIEFEKDDDHHMEFITSASNLRARSYGIPEEDMHKTRGIAGNIIPATITTTALITGFVCFELYKVVQKKPIEYYKNCYVNIGINLFIMSDVQECKPTIGGKWTLWDMFEIDEGRDITLQEFIDLFKTKYNIELIMVTFGAFMIYSPFGDMSKRLKYPLGKFLVKQGIKVFDKQNYFLFGINSLNHDSLPPVKYKFRGFKTKSKLKKNIIKKKKIMK